MKYNVIFLEEAQSVSEKLQLIRKMIEKPFNLLHREHLVKRKHKSLIDLDLIAKYYGDKYKPEMLAFLEATFSVCPKSQSDQVKKFLLQYGYRVRDVEDGAMNFNFSYGIARRKINETVVPARKTYYMIDFCNYFLVPTDGEMK